jgi:hypothetical protein
LGVEITGTYRRKQTGGHSFMEAFLYMLIVVLLIIAGVVISVRLYTRGAIGTGRIKRIRRLRSLRPGSGSTAVEETVEEVIEEEVPV